MTSTPTSDTESPAWPPIATKVVAGLLIVCFHAAAEPALVEAAISIPQTSERFDELLAQWEEAESDSAAEEAAAQGLAQYVSEILGSDALDLFGRFMEAPTDSAEERDLGEEVRQVIGRQQEIREPRAYEMLLAAWLASGHEDLNGRARDLVAPRSSSLQADEYGAAESLDPLPVDLQIMLPRSNPVAGELFTVIGRLHNRSDQPVWIVDSRTTLTIPVEVWGMTRQGGSLGAFFPTIKARISDEIVRLEPDRSYIVVWTVDGWRLNEPSKPAGWREVFSRVHAQFREFLFFKPGTYTLSANAHVWPGLPVGIKNGESFTVTATKDIYIETSHWVLVFGATIGALCCFALLALFRLRDGPLADERSEDLGPWYKSLTLRYLLIGSFMAVLLSSIVTILLSRLSTSDFLISVSVRDFWGAVATGFVIQWLGVTYFLDRLAGLRNGGGDGIPAGPTAATPQPPTPPDLQSPRSDDADPGQGVGAPSPARGPEHE